MTFRMPVRSLRKSYEELRPILEDMTEAVCATPPDMARYSKHLNRLGVIFQYAYYTSLVKERLPHDAVVCDWGGQYGHLARLLREYFPNTICYLPDTDAEFHTSYFHERFGVTDLVRMGPGYGDPRISLPDAAVDGMISSGVLEHTREYGVTEEASLSEIWRVLRPGGLLFVWMLPRQWGSVELLNGALKRSVHPYKYRQQDIVRLLEGTGFDIELIDRHELLNFSSRELLGKFIGHVNAWNVDYYFSKAFLFGALCQWYTVIARKPPVTAPGSDHNMVASTAQ